MWSDYYNSVMRAVAGLGPNEWLVVMIAVVLLGFFCMKGFGSRSDY